MAPSAMAAVQSGSAALSSSSSSSAYFAASLSGFGASHSHGKTGPIDGGSGSKNKNGNGNNGRLNNGCSFSPGSVASTASECRVCPSCRVASPSRTRALSSASCKNSSGNEGRATRRGKLTSFRSLSWRLGRKVTSSLEQDFRMSYSSVQTSVAFPPLSDLTASSSLTNTHMLTAQMYGSNVEGAEDSSNSCHILDRPSKKQVCLFYCSETEELAQRIASDSDAIELRSISWGQFKDGFPNVFVPNAHGIRNRHVAFLASFSSPAVIFEQLSIIYALPRMFISSFTLVLPFFPTGTQERMEDEGDVATAFTLARILSNIPISRGGPASVVIFDIHALQERFYFGDHVLPCFSSAIPLLKNRLHQLPDSDNITIAFPDEGAWKRFYRQLQHYPMVVCTKVRDGNNRIVTLKEGNPKGRHVVIVDDLVQSGSTLIECQKLLVSLGASSVSAYATHGVFPQRSWERFIHDPEGINPKFTHFWITDSCPLTAKAVAELQPFEVLSLAGLIQSALQI